jgi:CRISPR-associated protein (TIGR02710 family)
MSKALILSVGMSVESEIFAIQYLRPDLVAFICTHGSRQKIDVITQQTNLQPSKFQIYELPDDPAQIGNLVSQAHEAYRWIGTKLDPEGEVIVNPTAGRKWMSTGMTLFASQTDAKIIYIDARYENGEPVRDTMQVVDLGNPDDATGMLAAKEPTALFNRGDFEGSAAGFGQLRPTLAAPRRLYEALKGIAAALAQWDRFEHYDNSKVPEALERAANEVLGAAKELNMSAAQSWAESVSTLAKRIRAVYEAEKPSLDAIADLYANALRKTRQGRYEDAGARLYRVLEAIAQWMLHQKKVAPSEVNWSQIPDAAKERFLRSRRDVNGPLPTKLGLTDAFLLARALDCEGIEHFFDDKGFALASEIEIRNQSILAHGWTPATKKKVEYFSEKIRERLKTFDLRLDDWHVPPLPNLWQ